MIDINTPAHKHARRVDDCLRRIRRALEPIEADLDTCGRVRAPCTTIAAAPSVWANLAEALRDSEPWPMELLGPVLVLQGLADDAPGAPPHERPCWFTRGHHSMEGFMLFARSEGRRLGLTLLQRPGLPTQQCVYMRFKPSVDPVSGVTSWIPGVPAYDLDSVPVTVWFPADVGSPA